MTNAFVRLLATFFYIGELPLAPGSLASAAGALLTLGLPINPAAHLAAIAFVCGIGFFVSGKMAKIVNEKDPSCVVIDEVAGIMITLFMVPVTWSYLLTAFFLFRAFDMFKIYPVNKAEAIPGGAGIMLDDIVAGIYANAIMHIGIALSKIF